MPSAYIPIAIFVVVATGFALFTLVVSGLISSEKYNKVKFEPYECGIEPITGARERYSIRYYLVAMLFVIFDVETVFMFPWAVIFDKLLAVRPDRDARLHLHPRRGLLLCLEEGRA